MTSTDFIERHPVANYYRLACAIPWAARTLLIAGWTGPLPRAQQAAQRSIAGEQAATTR